MKFIEFKVFHHTSLSYALKPNEKVSDTFTILSIENQPLPKNL